MWLIGVVSLTLTRSTSALAGCGRNSKVPILGSGQQGRRQYEARVIVEHGFGCAGGRAKQEVNKMSQHRIFFPTRIKLNIVQ